MFMSWGFLVFGVTLGGGLAGIAPAPTRFVMVEMREVKSWVWLEWLEGGVGDMGGVTGSEERSVGGAWCVGGVTSRVVLFEEKLLDSPGETFGGGPGGGNKCV